MKADFSRGFNPDQKRGKQYRRVLLQQGRVLLDSDAAALVDANDRLLRQEAQDLGTDAGGRGHGFLVTQGHLYSVFDSKANVRATPTPAQLRIDYSARFRDRFPALLVSTTTAATTVTIDLLQPHDRTKNLVIWVAADPPTVTLTVTGSSGAGYTGPTSPVTVHAPPAFDRLVFTPTGGGGFDQSINITVAGNQKLWIGFIESDQTAATQPFWIQPGRYHVQGLMLANPVEASYPDQAFPASVGFPTPPPAVTLATTDTGVAYLEGWERLVTALQDPGIREQALSSSLDTTVRTAAIGQVKLTSVANAQIGGITPTPAQLRAAFTNHFVPDGTLRLFTADVAAAENPCAITLDNGFTGRENHLYHFEVHSYDSGTHLGQIKWSREAGSEIFGVVTINRGTATISVLPTSSLRDGDLVEVLTDVVELGDGAPGTLTLTGGQLQFVAARRDVGVLAALRAQVPDASGNNQFLLVQPSNPQQAVTLDAARYDFAATATPPSVRLRRWHGVLPTTGTAIPLSNATPLQIPLESGLIVEIRGTFEVGDWWQLEARLQPNDNGAPLFPTLTRHGPERLFSPLAQLAATGASDSRPQITAWLDQPFVPAAQIDAEHIKYDQTVALQVVPTVNPAVTPMPAPTLQGVLDDLLLYGPGQTITKQITHIWPNNQLTGNWQLSAGDGINSFGDFNGQDAIFQAVAFARSLAVMDAAGHFPWTMRLFLKRGTYTITQTLTIGPFEMLTLEGEGINEEVVFTDQNGDLIADAGPIGATLIAGLGFHFGTGDEIGFNVSGPSARLAFENLMFDQATSGRFNAPMAISSDQEGQLKFTGCLLRNQPFILTPVGRGPEVEEALVIRDSTLDFCPISVRFNISAGRGPSLWSVPRIRLEDCDITPAGPLVQVVNNSPEAATQWAGIHVKNSKITLGGTSSSGVAAGLVQVSGGDNPLTLSVGDLIFEDCQVDAGGTDSSSSGQFLFLPMGSNPGDPASRVKTIASVVIRGGRWTIKTDTPIAGVAPLYIGLPTFVQDAFPRDNSDLGVNSVVIENVEMGWDSTSPNMTYGSTDLFPQAAFVLYANEVLVRNVTLFGIAPQPGPGEMAILARRITVDGLRMKLRPFESGAGGGLPPVSRLHIFASQTGGAEINNVEIPLNGVSGALPAARGMITLSPLGKDSQGDFDFVRPIRLTNCHVEGDGGAVGYYSPATEAGPLYLELVQCAARLCFIGADVTCSEQSVAIRSCRFSLNNNVGLHVLCDGSGEFRPGTRKVIIESNTIITNGSSGIVFAPSPIFTGSSWGNFGPEIINNRVAGNAVPQIFIGAANKDNIGGVCMGNDCGPVLQNNGAYIHVEVSNTYLMRGLATNGQIPWGQMARTDTAAPPGTVPTGATFSIMTLNNAGWSRNS